MENEAKKIITITEKDRIKAARELRINEDEKTRILMKWPLRWSRRL